MDFWSLAQPFIGAALGSGFAVTGLKLWYDHRKDSGKRDERAKFLATQIVYQLEGYAVDTADKLSDHGLAADMSGDTGTLLMDVPKVPDLPKSEDYPLLPPGLVEDLYAFPQRAQMASSFVRFHNVIGSDEDVANAAYEQSFLIAEAALRIASAIRKQFGLGDRPLIHGKFDVRKYIDSNCEHVRKKEDERNRWELGLDDETP